MIVLCIIRCAHIVGGAKKKKKPNEMAWLLSATILHYMHISQKALHQRIKIEDASKALNKWAGCIWCEPIPVVVVVGSISIHFCWDICVYMNGARRLRGSISIGGSAHFKGRKRWAISRGTVKTEKRTRYVGGEEFPFDCNQQQQRHRQLYLCVSVVFYSAYSAHIPNQIV